MKFPLQDSHLEKLHDEETSVTVMLTNGVKLFGQISSVDQFVIAIKTNAGSQLVYKRAILFIQAASLGARQKVSSTLGMSSHDRLSVQALATNQAPTTKAPVIVRKKLRTVVPPTDLS